MILYMDKCSEKKIRPVGTKSNVTESVTIIAVRLKFPPALYASRYPSSTPIIVNPSKYVAQFNCPKLFINPVLLGKNG